MVAALATLTFLATLWLLIVLAAVILEESGARIAAALGGQQDAGQPLVVRARLRSRVRSRQPMRATPRWRDAA